MSKRYQQLVTLVLGRRIKAPLCEASGKRAWPTKPDALASALRSATRRGVTVRTYQCRDCECWHLTRSPERPTP